jgi:hypothetical protein
MNWPIWSSRILALLRMIMNGLRSHVTDDNSMPDKDWTATEDMLSSRPQDVQLKRVCGCVGSMSAFKTWLPDWDNPDDSQSMLPQLQKLNFTDVLP